MKIYNYGTEEGETNFQKTDYKFMPDRCFRMLICAPSEAGKTNLFLEMIQVALLW